MLNAQRTLLQQAVALFDAITLTVSFAAAYFHRQLGLREALQCFRIYLALGRNHSDLDCRSLNQRPLSGGFLRPRSGVCLAG